MCDACGVAGIGHLVVAPFFFQAEGGIRAPLVTGVQTCALPILSVTRGVQFVPFGLLKIVPLSPVTKYKLRKTPTPCKSLVVGRGWTAYQTTPNVLTVWLVTMPSMFVTVTLVSAYGL